MSEQKTGEMPFESAVFGPEAREHFDISIEPVSHPIDLFELSLPRPPQGTWREKFDIRADVRFAYVDLKFEKAIVRVATRGARLSSDCVGCSFLPHSLYGTNPLPSRSIVSVQERQSHRTGASAEGQLHVRLGGLQGVDAAGSLDTKASGEAERRVEKQGTREEIIPRIVPRPHGAWEFSEPHRSDGCLDGDYLTSRGQYLETPSDDPADRPLATVQSDAEASEIQVSLTIEIQPKDLVFRKIVIGDGPSRRAKAWFGREQINAEIIARRLVELAHTQSGDGEVRVRLGTTVLRGKRRQGR